MSDYKICPLMKGSYDDVMVFRNVEPSAEVVEALSDRKNVGISVRDYTDERTIEPLTGTCKESACAWWDELKQCCAVLTIARSSRHK